MNRSQVPYGGILLTCGICVLGVGLNYLVPSQAFEIVLNVACLGIVATWVIIMLCHLVFVRRARAGLLTRPRFRLRGSPVTELATVAFLLACLGMMWNDPDVGRKTLLLIPVVAVMLVAGWYGIRHRVGKSAR
ncbi:L-asparagine permease OS=Streptomyces fumanus OX=67302 GN=ansP PE=3 SV=1 [Streptomyces fumanus]